MKGLLIDPDRRLAWAQPGLTAGEVTAAAAEHGLAVPFGDTANVGIGGLTTGGGIGFLTRKFGLTIDNLVAAEIVTADGRILTVDEERHPDLFWAIRGGGGNVGVVTRFVYRLVEVGMVLGGGLVLPATADVIAGLVAAAEGGARGADPHQLRHARSARAVHPAGPRRRAGRDGPRRARRRPRGRQAALAPFRALAEPVADLVGPMPYPAIYQFTAEGRARGGGSIRSWFADDLDVADAETISTLDASRASPAVIAQIRVLGGAMARVAPEATAFAQRDASPRRGDGPVRRSTAIRLRATPGREAFFTTFRYRDDRRLRELPRRRGRGPVRAAYPDATYERSWRQAPLRPGQPLPANQNIRPA